MKKHITNLFALEYSLEILISEIVVIALIALTGIFNTETYPWRYLPIDMFLIHIYVMRFLKEIQDYKSNKTGLLALVYYGLAFPVGLIASGLLLKCGMDYCIFG